MKRKYEPSYDVTLTLKVSTRIDFANFDGGEEDEITLSDAIENAIGGLDYGEIYPLSIRNYFIDRGYELALPIEGEAKLIDYLVNESDHG